MILSRQEAKARGLTCYFTGSPCVHGHVARRWTKNGTCDLCHVERQAAYRKTERWKALNKIRGAKWRVTRSAAVRRREAEAAKQYNRRPEVVAVRQGAAWKKKVMEWNRRYMAKQEVREAARARDRRRYATEPSYRLSVVLRARLRMAIRNGYKTGSAVRQLGCSLDEARVYIESHFADGMSWRNYGDWHIDHKRPLASFDLSDEKQVALACHFTNLAPLWALENVRKGARYVA